MTARLTVERGSAEPAVYDLPPGRVVSLGRNHGNSIQIHDRFVSRQHAEILPDETGRWLLRQCPDATNATSVNGRPISAPIVLEHGHLIDIGDTRLRFHLTPDGATVGTSHAEAPVEIEITPSDRTVLMADDLSVLVQFMDQALREETKRGLIRLALQAVLRITGADVAGFLNLDAADPEPQMVLPALSSMNRSLSRYLTQAARRGKRSVWLGASPAAGEESNSLSGLVDAVCVPLPTSHADEPAPGALHVYQTTRSFSARQFRFCEVLAGHLASNLRALGLRLTLEADNGRLRAQTPDFGDVLLGDSPAMAQLRDKIGQLGGAPCPVLILGESGVGKELVALALHRASAHGDEPLVQVNAATIVSNLAESQLFGHEDGAFTGAAGSHRGYFQQADGGTLFIDEIGDLAPDCQAKLLRVLEDQTFPPVGAEEPVKVTARVLAATNCNLDEMMKTGRFRRDLFFRLGTKLRVPPLREHLEDVPLLAKHFLDRLNQAHRKYIRLSTAAEDRLRTFDWPGNVRQLRSVLESAFFMVPRPDHVLAAADLHLDEEGAPHHDGPASYRIEDVEAWAIRKVLAQTRTNVEAAHQLEINRETLALKMKKYGIERGGD